MSDSFRIKRPILTLFADPHRCNQAQSSDIPQFVQRLLAVAFQEKPSARPAYSDRYAHAARLCREVDYDYIEAINSSEDMDEAYCHLITHHIGIARALLEVAGALSGDDSAEDVMRNDPYFQRAEHRILTEIDELLNSAEGLRANSNPKSAELYRRLKVTPGNLQTSRHAQEKTDPHFKIIRGGLHSLNDEISQYVQSHTGNRDFHPHGPILLALAQRFLGEAQAHAIDWQYSFHAQSLGQNGGMGV